MGFGIQLMSDRAVARHANQRLVTHGPFAFVRHPMYLGIMTTSFWGLLIYHTWMFAFLSILFWGLVMGARRNEQALVAEFGQQWEMYCQQVPPWIPRFWRLNR